ncbi:MAG: DNA alkylation repair protein [Heliobacteriaceae bacterium]|jgi:3-methyladenine DNA glycosylase AlkD|nr:DNA alkylation repair protein [Heliobacteriaceae bacterium]
MDIRQRLLDEAQKDYKKFTAGLIPGAQNILGVRLPVLRQIAKEIITLPLPYVGEGWGEGYYHEEILLQGLVIGLLKDDPETILRHVKDFIPKITNWAVCDTFCTGLKFTKKNKKPVWEFLQPYLASDKEFEVRFGVVMLLAYFVDDEYIDAILQKCDEICATEREYYIKMAVAWAVSVCYVKFPEKTHKYLENSRLEPWTYNKSIQKICESFRVDKDAKALLKTMKK